MAFTENDPGVWKYENDGDQIEGVVIKIQSNVGSNKSMMYTLEVDEKPVSVWGSAILDQKMIGIKEGDLIQIVYKGLGEAKGGHNPPKMFQVLVDRPTKQEPALVQPTAPVAPAQPAPATAPAVTSQSTVPPA